MSKFQIKAKPSKKEKKQCFCFRLSQGFNKLLILMNEIIIVATVTDRWISIIIFIVPLAQAGCCEMGPPSALAETRHCGFIVVSRPGILDRS